MPTMTVQAYAHEDLIVKDPVWRKETLVADLTGTAGSITDTTTYAVTDQDGLTSIVTVDGGAAQTVTFAGATTTALQVAAQMNDQLTGCSVVVTGGQVVITSDSTGLTSSVAVAAGTGDLTWGTAVAGTGQTATWAKGTLLARNTSSKKITIYSDAGSTGENEPVAVLSAELVWAASGDKEERVLEGGVVFEAQLAKHDDATAIDTLVFDKLRKNSGIIPVKATAHGGLDNS